MTTVILAEKPSQARSYVEAFVNSHKEQGYYVVSDPVLLDKTYVTYGFGHLVELAEPKEYDPKYEKWAIENLPILPESYKFKVSSDKKAQFNIVKKLVAESDNIIVATDSDREGENIAWSILTQTGIDLKSKTIKRLWINSLEKEAILDGFRNLKNGWDYYPAYKEAQTRQISDWLVGINGSQLYTLLMNSKGIKGTFSIGRVQTPTLYLIYKREQEVQNFKPTPFIEINAEILADGQKFVAKLDPYKRFLEQNQLDTFMEYNGAEMGSQGGLIKGVEKNNKKTASPRLFSLSTLQSEINRRYHASASEVLSAMQKLYESKLLTYPRTDSNYITEQEYEYLLNNLERYKELAFIDSQLEFNNTQPDSRHVNGKKVQEHHAIIMTKTIPKPDVLDSLSNLERQIYEVVVRNTLAMFMPPYQYKETVITVAVGKLIFKATGKTPVNQGWKAIMGSEDTTDPVDKSNQDEQELPDVQENKQVIADIKQVQRQTTPPALYTEGTLITAMKTAGKTVDNADDEVVDILKEVEGIGTEATRANVIETLKKRAYIVTEKNKLHVTEQGKTLCHAVELQPLLTSAKMTAQWEKALKQISRNERTPDNFISQIQRFIQKLVDEVPAQIGENQSVNEQIDKQISMQAKAEEDSYIVACKQCGVGHIVDKKTFYGCTNYKGDNPCNFTLPKKWSGKTLGKTAIKQLVETGETSVIKGFKSKKTGKSFDAKLQLENDKLQFEF